MCCRDHRGPRVLGLFALCALAACGGEQLRELFDAYTPHERYERLLRAQGFDQTALGREWVTAAASSLAEPVSVQSPFREEGFLDPRAASAVAYAIDLRRGQRVTVTFESAPDAAFQVFLDLFAAGEAAPERLASADSLARALAYVARHDGTFLVRVQPELLRGGRYAVTIVVGPTLAFPVHGRDTMAIRSRYGAPRDAGRRRHEGLDIFAPRGTPVLAAADGVVRSTRSNRLGGNVVWLRDDLGRSHYYAHLERHAVTRGVRVRTGDTIGFVGNSGNARTTPPHLHFGVYRRGSFDPFPALQPLPSIPPTFAGDAGAIGTVARIAQRAAAVRQRPSRRAAVLTDLPLHTALRIDGGVGEWYRVALPDGVRGYVAAAAIEAAAGPIRSTVLAEGAGVYAVPGRRGLPVDSVPAGVEVPVIGAFGEALLISGPRGRVGWVGPP